MCINKGHKSLVNNNMTLNNTHMEKLTVQIFLDNAWKDAATVTVFATEQGHRERTRLDYLPEFVIEHLDDANSDGAVVSYRYPVNFEIHDELHWPAFLLDMVPGGEGRRRWVDRLGLVNGLSAELMLLTHAADNPVGNLRIRESVESPYRQIPMLPDEQGQLTEKALHAGFSKDSIVQKQEHFIEYAYNLGAAVAGATDVQGEAPKFLLVTDANGQWHAEGALEDDQVQSHWIVKFPRGNSQADRKVLCNEAPYLEVARLLGLHVGSALELAGEALFIPRFDRCVSQGRVERFAVESLYSLAGIAEFGAATSHEVFVESLMQCVHPNDRFNTTLEYIRRDLINVVMGNKDNHGRNTAVMRDRHGRVRLSPLFDFAPMYLDPQGIARITRWQPDRETAGQPDWQAVSDFFSQWVDVNQLRRELLAFMSPLSNCLDMMHSTGVDADIIERCRIPLQRNLEMLGAFDHG